MFEALNTDKLPAICDFLAEDDPDLRRIIAQYGYPPFWSRPNTFESLVHIILEQQVSLASALAALNKLKQKIGKISPDCLLTLSDEELKACYFSRQKIKYVRHLAESLLEGTLSLSDLERADAITVRHQLKTIKGIGDWTVDIYLIFVLHHPDIFPAGDLAAVNAIKSIKGLPLKASREQILYAADAYRPYRTVAVMLLWHFYLSIRRKANQQIQK